MIIIGFGSKARNGKDTAGEAIVQHYATQSELLRLHGLQGGLKVSIVKFAEAVYKEAKEQHGMTEKDPVLLQNIGMARRTEDKNYWINKAFEAIPQGMDIVIFTDVRFQNEAERIKSEGGCLIEVVRLNADSTRYYSKDRPADHPSEIDLDNYNWDYRITAKSGESGLLGEYAITLVEYLRGLHA